MPPDAAATLPPRPAYIGEGIHTAHRARVAHVCESCGSPIPKGSMYVRHALPPNSERGNTGWWRIVSCGWTTGDCRRYRSTAMCHSLVSEGGTRIVDHT